MKLDALRFGLACGILWAVAVIFIAIVDLVGWGVPLFRALGSLYIGYGPGFGGALIGGIWAFFDAGIGALIVAALYNWLVGMKKA